MRLDVFVLLLGFSLFLAILRVLGYKSPAYQSVAHGFVGALFGCYLTTRIPGYLCLGMALTLVELCVFSVQYALGKSS